MVASSCVLILAQRLVRRLCPQCKEVEKIPPETLMSIGFSQEDAHSSMVTYKGKGCPTCNNNGYKGRLGLYEVLPIGEEIKALILEGANPTEIKKKAISLGMKTLRMSGLEKIKGGLTSVEEVTESTFSD
jgi:type IV pilus assembly protein PilB